MNRCKECARPITDTDNVCQACRHHEWTGTRKAIDEMHSEFWIQERRKRSGLVQGIAVAILFILGLLFIANIPDALEYEESKYRKAIELNER